MQRFARVGTSAVSLAHVSDSLMRNVSDVHSGYGNPKSKTQESRAEGLLSLKLWQNLPLTLCRMGKNELKVVLALTPLQMFLQPYL